MGASLRETASKAVNQVSEINKTVLEATAVNKRGTGEGLASSTTKPTAPTTPTTALQDPPAWASAEAAAAGGSATPATLTAAGDSKLANATKEELIDVLQKLNKKMKALSAMRVQLTEKAQKAEEDLTKR